jgi:hypothetical protein
LGIAKKENQMKQAIKAILAASLLAGAMSAQIGGPGGPPPFPGGPRGRGQFGPGPFGPGMHARKVVSGAPYSATATSSFTQTLPGNNTIQRTTTATIARDGAGRTYEQETITGGPLAATNGPTTITFITDPVAGYSYVINANTKTVTRRPFHAEANGAKSNFTRPQRPPDPNVQETPLSATTLNGVNVTGKTVTRTIPAGQIGNAQPITSTDTVYFSPDLQVVVSATRNDPRIGSSTYALTNIQRGDPPASWFQIPSDYTIQDAKGPGRGPRPPQE